MLLSRTFFMPIYTIMMSRLCLSFSRNIALRRRRIASASQKSATHHVAPPPSNKAAKRQCHTRFLSSSSTAAAATDTAAIYLHRDPEELYQELQQLSTEIRRHDEIYYLNGSESELSDEEYDALVAREAQLCRDYPHALHRLEQESGLGQQATRYGGRVGPVMNVPEEEAVSADRFRKRQHLEKMYSLNNALSVEEVLAWLERIRKTLIKRLTDEDKENGNNMQVEILTEPKLDGLSLALRYSRRAPSSHWEFEWAATRGDGKQGQDVSVAVEQGLEVPLSFDWPLDDEKCSTLEVRGEVVLPESVFQALPTENATFSNARNAASGILLRNKQLEDYSEVKKLRKHLRFYAYGVATMKGSESLPGGMQLRSELMNLGFLVPQPTVATILTLNNETEWTESDIQPMIDYHNALETHRQGADSINAGSLKFDDYGMDGCVHKVSSHHLRKALGHTPRAPRWAIAHKFAAETVVTKIMAVDVQVGRTGALTPVAKLEPVELNGVLIQRATLHNFGHMRQALGSDRIPVGSPVLVRRAGEVIPQVLRRVESHEPTNENNTADTEMISLQVPDKCPACGSPVAMDEVNRAGSSKISVGQVLRCAGPPLLCQPRAVSALVHTFSRDALDVTGVSQARLEKLMDLNFLRTPVDLFLFAKNETLLEKLAEEDGWGKKSVQNLAEKVNSVVESGVTLTRFIYSLGIRFVGLQSSELIAGVYGKVDDFVGAVKEVKDLEDPYDSSFLLLREDNEATKGIGPSVLTALVQFSLEPELVGAAVALSQTVKVHEQEVSSSSSGKEATDISTTNSPLAGLKIVFTGTVQGLARTKAKDIAKAMGAKSIGNTVSKSTDIVVAGSKGGKKLEEAEKHGVRVVGGEEFLVMVKHFTNARDEK